VHQRGMLVPQHVQPQQHHGSVHRNQAQESPCIEAGKSDLTGLLIFPEQNRPHQEAAEGEKQVHSQIPAPNPPGKRSGEDGPPLFGESAYVEEHHVQHEYPENRYGAYAVQNGLVKPRPPGQLLPVASKVENARYRRFTGGRIARAAPFELIMSTRKYSIGDSMTSKGVGCAPVRAVLTQPECAYRTDSDSPITVWTMLVLARL
jgi:hypothetical protein